jgi:hypothetical protein
MERWYFVVEEGYEVGPNRGSTCRLDRRGYHYLAAEQVLAQFTLLVGVNALVGGMIGQERTVLPLLAERIGLGALTAALTFIVAFGLTNMPAAIWTVAAITALSGMVVAVRMYETHRRAPGERRLAGSTP